MSRIHVTIGDDSSRRGGLNRIAAYVVRADPGGMGIEWQEFAPLPVLELIEPDRLIWIEPTSGLAVEPQPWRDAGRPGAPPP